MLWMETNKIGYQHNNTGSTLPMLIPIKGIFVQEADNASHLYLIMIYFPQAYWLTNRISSKTLHRIEGVGGREEEVERGKDTGREREREWESDRAGAGGREEKREHRRARKGSYSRESRRRKRENARRLGNTSTLVSRAFVNTPWDASALGDWVSLAPLPSLIAG